MHPRRAWSDVLVGAGALGLGLLALLVLVGLTALAWSVVLP